MIYVCMHVLPVVVNIYIHTSISANSVEIKPEMIYSCLNPRAITSFYLFPSFSPYFFPFPSVCHFLPTFDTESLSISHITIAFAVSEQTCVAECVQFSLKYPDYQYNEWLQTFI